MNHPDVLLYEEEAWASGFLRLAGIDEAGRGPLAGPVVAAAVIFDPDYIRAELVSTFGKLTDSKAMPEKRREEFFRILESCDHVRIGVGIIEPAEIDEINILQATHKAMGLAAAQVEADFALVDGLPVKGLPCEHRSIVKGDALSISISAASIIAKVTRDRMMVALDEVYPEYGFAGHKGYGTKKHLEALQKYGATPVHRQSFRPVAELRQGELFE
ncbi:ribonuclease HII [Verrucomicrobia bacterium S94]|nr:ribonuclease HII [Verrucomicrobia bacterium S94]